MFREPFIHFKENLLLGIKFTIISLLALIACGPLWRERHYRLNPPPSETDSNEHDHSLDQLKMIDLFAEQVVNHANRNWRQDLLDENRNEEYGKKWYRALIQYISNVVLITKGLDPRKVKEYEREFEEQYEEQKRLRADLWADLTGRKKRNRVHNINHERYTIAMMEGKERSEDIPNMDKVTVIES